MVSSPRIWATSKDGLIEYISLTSETLEGGLEVMRKSFFLYEKVAIAVELPKNPKAIEELDDLSIRAAEDGVSLIARERETGKVVGVALNKLQVKLDEQETYFKDYIAKCKYPSAKAMLQFMIDADGVLDLFKISQANCLLEIMFLAVLPEFSNRGIGKKLFELSLDLAKTLASGNNVKTSLDGQPLPMEPFPTVVSAIFTSIVTQNMSKKLGFVKAAEISYESLFFDGKSFANRIGTETPTTTIEYKLL